MLPCIYCTLFIHLSVPANVINKKLSTKCYIFSVDCGQAQETVGSGGVESFFPSEELPQQQPDAAPATFGTIGGRIGWVMLAGRNGRR